MPLLHKNGLRAVSIRQVSFLWQERAIRLFCCVFISDLAKVVSEVAKQGQLFPSAISTAKIFLHRFYMSQSLVKQKNYKVD